MSKHFLDSDGLVYLWGKVKEADQSIKNEVMVSVEEAKTEIDSQIKSVGEQVSSISSELDSVKTDVEGVITSNASMVVEFDTMKDEFNTMKTNIEDAVEEAEAIQEEFATVKSDVNTLRNTLNAYNSSIANLQTSVGEHGEELTLLNAAEDVEGSLKYQFKKFEEETLEPALDMKASIVQVSDIEANIDTINVSIESLTETTTTLTGDDTVPGSVDYKVAALENKVNEELGKKATAESVSDLSSSVSEMSSKVSGNSSSIDAAKARLDVLEGTGDGSIDKKIETALAGLDIEIPETDLSEVNEKLNEHDTKFNTVEDRLNVIEGTGEGSISYAVAEVIANAPDDYNTLVEIATYIASDKTKAAEIESLLSSHSASISTLEGSALTLDAAIKAETTRATGVESGFETRIKALEDGGGEEFDPSLLEASIATNKTNIETNADNIKSQGDRLDVLESDSSIEGSVDYKDAELKKAIYGGADATTTLASIQSEIGTANTAISSEVSRATGVESGFETRIKALEESSGKYIEGITSADNLFTANSQSNNSVVITMTTQELSTATDKVDGLAKAHDVKTYIDTAIEEVNDVSVSYDERIGALEVFYASSITTAEIDAITNPESSEEGGEGSGEV